MALDEIWAPSNPNHFGILHLRQLLGLRFCPSVFNGIQKVRIVCFCHFPRGQECWVDLNLMKFYESSEFDQMRRLCTASCPSSSSNCYTVWKYFCRDHFGWREYSEVWPFPALLLGCSTL